MKKILFALTLFTVNISSNAGSFEDSIEENKVNISKNTSRVDSLSEEITSLKKAKVPAVVLFKKPGNNGWKSCDDYCQGNTTTEPWREPKGSCVSAKLVKSSLYISCNKAPGIGNDLICGCSKIP